VTLFALEAPFVEKNESLKELVIHNKRSTSDVPITISHLKSMPSSTNFDAGPPTSDKGGELGM